MHPYDCSCNDCQVSRIIVLLKQILKAIKAEEGPQSATLTFRGVNMPASIQVGGKGAQAVYQEFDGPNGTGNKVAPLGTVTYTSENPGVATVDQTSGMVAAVAAGTVNISGVDSGSGIAASDVLTVTTAPPTGPQSATLTLTAL